MELSDNVRNREDKSMNYLHYLFTLMFITNFPPLSSENPILTEITRSELGNKETDSTVTPVNRLIENSTEFYNVKDFGSTEREERNPNITENLSSFGTVFEEAVSIYQEGLNFTTSEKLVSTTPESEFTSILHEDWNSTMSSDNPISINSMHEINVTESDASTFQFEDQETGVPETESSDIVDLLDSLSNKLKVPSDNWLNYHYIMAMQSPDGSIYIPKNHTQSTRKHLITLLGFAEEIVSNKNGITYINNKNNNNEEKLLITTQSINDDTLILLENNISFIGENQSNIDYEKNITDNDQEFSEIDDEIRTFTEVSDLFSSSNITEEEEGRLMDYELHYLNESNDLHEILEHVTPYDVDHRISEQNNQSSTMITDGILFNITNELQLNSKQENITTDSMDNVEQQRTKLKDNQSMKV
ncbi:unnamed protein product [Schistosoma margrebowiei]|uniref:Uncharacterized protein n=1 Tax=Schistosoma margrebowiei TaxID=48269 RepID=A0A183MK53_9TREM|nr:unnamed protein product [Schistosoma margrebowiei]